MISLSLSVASTLYSYFVSPELFPWGRNALPWHIEYVFIAMFWMVLGYLFRNFYESRYDHKISSIVKSISVILYLLLSYIPYVFKIGFHSILTGIGYPYVATFLGLFALIYICKIIRPNKYFIYIGQNTLICLALHGKIYNVIQTVLKKFASDIYASILSNEWTSSLFAIIFTIMLSVILIIPIYIINRCFPFLIGRKYQKQRLE